jgi:formylglycine-generating enzyme required for sulfatase activity
VRTYPQHKITIAKPFAVSKFEVTLAEWGACVEVGGAPNAPKVSATCQ